MKRALSSGFRRFCPSEVQLASRRVLAAGLGFSSGIMLLVGIEPSQLGWVEGSQPCKPWQLRLYVSFIEIFQKASSASVWNSLETPAWLFVLLSLGSGRLKMDLRLLGLKRSTPTWRWHFLALCVLWRFVVFFSTHNINNPSCCFVSTLSHWAFD